MVSLASTTRIAAAAAVALAAVAAASDPPSTLEVLAQMPQCAQTCIVNAVLNSTCSATNQTCVCANDELQAAAKECVTQQCTIRESLFTMNLTQTSCGAPVRDSSYPYVVLSDTLGVFLGISVLQRIVAKLYWHLPIEADDWCILLTMVFLTVPSLVINVYGLVGNGMGLDIWTVPFDSITRFSGFFHAMSVLYFTQISLIKLSVLFFYLRVFSVSSARRIIIGTMIFNCTYGVIYMMVTIFQCLPVGYLAVMWDGEHQGRCINLSAMTWSNASISIAVDVWMLFIPLFQLRSLQLKFRQKLGAALMFFAGTAFTIISIVRLRTLVKFGYTDNPTWTYIEVSTWSTTEIAIGMICACMPSYRLLVVRLLYRGKDTRSEYTPNHGSTISGSHGKRSKKSAQSTALDSFTQIEESDKPRDASSSNGFDIHLNDIDSYNNDSDLEDQANLVRVQIKSNEAGEGTGLGKL